MPKVEENQRTLIAYATKSGVTRESAAIIAEVLRGTFHHEVDVVDLKKDPNPPLRDYRNVFIGSGIRMGRWYRRAKKLLERTDKHHNIVIFLSACSAGDTEKHNAAVQQYITDVLTTYPNIRTVAAEVFGGRIRMFGKTVEDNWNGDTVRAWAEQIGEKLRAE